MKDYSLVIVGGGSAGIGVAARCKSLFGKGEVALIDKAKDHCYQPLWTLVGAGQVTKESTQRSIGSLVPDGVKLIEDFVSEFQPDQNQILLENGDTIGYKYLVVCPGIQQDWHKIKGLEGNLGKNGICSNYDYNFVDSTWENIQKISRGAAVFTMPPMPIKCPGAPQKIMWLTEDYLRDKGFRKQVEVHFATATPGMFGIPKYNAPLTKMVAERKVIAHYRWNLIEVMANQKKAIFENLDSKETKELSYSMLHVVPPMSSPDFIKKSPIADDNGWVDVDKHSMQHKKFPNIFSLGDAASSPNSKTGAAIRKQAPVVFENMRHLMANRELTASYDGYASCPLVTSQNKCILAEFGYDGKIMETFPFDQAKERYSMYLLKKHLLPFMYWNFMLKGTM